MANASSILSYAKEHPKGTTAFAIGMAALGIGIVYNAISGLHPGAKEKSRYSGGFDDFGSGWLGMNALSLQNGAHPNDPHPELMGEEHTKDTYRYLKMAPSSIGLKESELFKYMTQPDSQMSEYVQASGSTGTAIHKYLEAKWLQEGIASEVEKLTVDPVLGMGGFIDVITPSGQIGDIKSLSQGRWKTLQRQGRPYPSHVSQIRSYQAMTGMTDQPGFITYVQADNPDMQQTYQFDFDMGAYMKDIQKLQRVRTRVERGIEQGWLNESELPKASSLEALQEQAAGLEDLGKANIGDMYQVYQDELQWYKSTKRGMPDFLVTQQQNLQDNERKQKRRIQMGNNVGLAQQMSDNRIGHYRY